jgi:hypothetical protein
MGIKDWFTRQSKVTTPAAPPPMPTVKPPKLTPKEIATKNGEPWVTVLGMDINVDNISEGNFELDWNDIFVAKLIRAGYKGKDDIAIVDQWFQDICRNIAMEQFEQEMADPEKRADWQARAANNLRPPSFDN